MVQLFGVKEDSRIWIIRHEYYWIAQRIAFLGITLTQTAHHNLNMLVIGSCIITNSNESVERRDTFPETEQIFSCFYNILNKTSKILFSGKSQFYVSDSLDLIRHLVIDFLKECLRFTTGLVHGHLKL